jgi:hypothetical protein
VKFDSLLHVNSIVKKCAIEPEPKYSCAKVLSAQSQTMQSNIEVEGITFKVVIGMKGFIDFRAKTDDYNAASRSKKSYFANAALFRIVTDALERHKGVVCKIAVDGGRKKQGKWRNKYCCLIVNRPCRCESCSECTTR